MNKNYFGCAWRIFLSCECKPGSHKIKGSNHTIAAFDFMIVIAICSYTTPCAIMAFATFRKPATFAPFT